MRLRKLALAALVVLASACGGPSTEELSDTTSTETQAKGTPPAGTPTAQDPCRSRCYGHYNSCTRACQGDSGCINRCESVYTTCQTECP